MYNLIKSLSFVEKTKEATRQELKAYAEGTMRHSITLDNLAEINNAEKEVLKEISNAFCECEDLILGCEFYEVCNQNGSTKFFTYDDEYAKRAALFSNLPLKRVNLKKKDDIINVEVHVYDLNKMMFA